MQVKETPLYQFLEGSGKKFIIPVYQRDYSWSKNNCQKLWDDIVILSNSQRIDHFLGTIVGVVNNYSEYVIIDGQQRLTTSSLLLLALHNFLKNLNNKSHDDINLQNQLLEFLVDKYSTDVSKIRLKPNLRDEIHFSKLFDNPQNNATDITSNIYINYQFFYNKIQNLAISRQQFFDNFRKLKIILIDLVRGNDDPQLIFESLNSTGVDLESTDLIRNYILMDLEPQIQENYYKKYWIEIENFVNDRFEIFAQNYLMLKNQIYIKNDDVYENFKKLAINKFNNDKELILQDLLYYSKFFSIIFQMSKHKNHDINIYFQKIMDLEFGSADAYFMELLSDLDSGNLDVETVINVIKLIENYVFRKIFVDSSTKSFNKFFVILTKEIKKHQNWRLQYFEILKYILINRAGSTKFPTNDDFVNALINREVYRMKNSLYYLMENLENFNSPIKISTDDLEIEHIMPRNLTKDWQLKLGENYRDIHKKYLDTLGNLTWVTSTQNKKLGNLSKEQKDKIDYQQSKLKLNYKLSQDSNWNAETIEARAKSLANDAVNIWPYPITSFFENKPSEIIYDLGCDEDFSGQRPFYMEINNEKINHEIKSWRDFLRECCNYFYQNYSYEFELTTKKSDIKNYFDANNLRTPLEFSHNKFIESNLSANSIFNLCQKICEYLDFNPEKIKFKCK